MFLGSGNLVHGLREQILGVEVVDVDVGIDFQGHVHHHQTGGPKRSAQGDPGPEVGKAPLQNLLRRTELELPIHFFKEFGRDECRAAGAGGEESRSGVRHMPPGWNVENDQLDMD